MTMFVEGDDGLSPMEEIPYEAEAVLQELLVTYPSLLTGGSSGDGSRWLLVQRELGIASEEDGSSRWSLDHLFLDSDGIPTLVEVKRSSDTRIRREVVGQMLDYAANGSAVWSQESIRASFEASTPDSEEVLDDFLGEGAGSDQFWERVGLNLRAGKLRLVFVADAIPSELRRIIEYLNGQMTETEVIGVEIKRFRQTGGGLVSYVSSVIGRTEVARSVKGAVSRGKVRWVPDDLERELTENFGPEMAARAMDLHYRLIDAGGPAGHGWRQGAVGKLPAGGRNLDPGQPEHVHERDRDQLRVRSERSKRGRNVASPIRGREDSRRQPVP